MAKENKPASAYAGRYKEVDMKGVTTKPGPNNLAEMNISVGNNSKGKYAEKTDGIKMRGTGAATKGLMSRGPMA